MTFGVLNASPHPGQPQKLPSFGNQFSSALGQGLGEGVNKGISDAIKGLALRRALGLVNPEQSVLEKFMAISETDPETRQYLTQNLFPALQNESDSSALSQLYGQESPLPTATEELFSKNNQEIPGQESPSPEPALVQQQAPVATRSQNIQKSQAFQRLSPAAKQQYLKEQVAAQKAADAASKDFFEETMGAMKAYNSERLAVEKMKALEKSGNLTNPLQAKIANALDMPSLLSDESQQFQKLTNQFLTNIRPLFGSQVSNQEVQTYLKGVPQLINTAGGRKRIYEDLEQMNNLRKLQFDIQQRIIQQNGGRRPADLEQRVRTSMQPYIETMVDKIKEGSQQRITVEKDGKRFTLPESNFKEAEKLGYKKI